MVVHASNPSRFGRMRLRQENHKLKTGLGTIVRPCFKQKSQVWWHIPVVSVTWVAQVGRSQHTKTLSLKTTLDWTNK